MDTHKILDDKQMSRSEKFGRGHSGGEGDQGLRWGLKNETIRAVEKEEENATWQRKEPL